MSNVEYRCPICGHRGFFPPNTHMYKCPFHTDTLMEQHEDYVGPNFAFKEEGEVNPKKTGVRTWGAVDEAGKPTITPVITQSIPHDLSEEEELKHLRDMWERVFNEPVDKRLGAPRLRREIEEQETKAGLELEMQEAEALVDNNASDFNYARSDSNG